MKFIEIKTIWDYRISLNIDAIESVVEKRENETEIYVIGADPESPYIVRERYDDVIRKIKDKSEEFGNKVFRILETARLRNKIDELMKGQ